ncbi:MAG: response regulator [Nitrospirae bacterium]|nr:response regulator [Nitrospirota bacterium]MBI3350958.1 response regulator [Nitrospirota bacterium]
MNKKVLVIEDSSTMRSLIVTTVEDLKGFETVEVKNGIEALKMLPTQKFDLIITDINMPNINGLEVVSFVKGHPQYQMIPMIIVSTEQGKKEIQKGLSLGASDYLTKPFHPENLKKVIQKVMSE